MVNLIFSSILLLLASMTLWAEEAYEEMPVAYSLTKSQTKIDQLIGELNQKVLPKWIDAEESILPQLLKYLEVPISSQLLVFSATSLQRSLIHPETPRAIYFNDDIYIGYCQKGLIEIIAVDGTIGPVFYRMKEYQEKGSYELQRDNQCLTCHGDHFTRDIAGLIVRSVYPNAEGRAIGQFGSDLVEVDTDIKKRWGGWFVTGLSEEVEHRGNQLYEENSEHGIAVLRKVYQESKEKPQYLKRYLTDQSDVLTLMVFEHQCQVQNVLTAANQGCLRAMYRQEGVQKSMGEKITAEPEGSAVIVFDNAVEDILDVLLFKDEADLPEGGIEGNESFINDFQQKGKKNADGKSLRDFQLLNRLFKYRCSYMIESMAFQKLMPKLKEQVDSALRTILSDGSERYAYLGKKEREIILSIIDKN
jgi:hypothetical protein